ncbi:hypothetical protein NFI96_004010 [Prochilodus magdalenae]|nr:hypothetical protein NFI96_004010 [Prochilodus magdalenae]
MPTTNRSTPFSSKQEVTSQVQERLEEIQHGGESGKGSETAVLLDCSKGGAGGMNQSACMTYLPISTTTERKMKKGVQKRLKPSKSPGLTLIIRASNKYTPAQSEAEGKHERQAGVEYQRVRESEENPERDPEIKGRSKPDELCGFQELVPRSVSV